MHEENYLGGKKHQKTFDDIEELVSHREMTLRKLTAHILLKYVIFIFLK